MNAPRHLYPDRSPWELEAAARLPALLGDWLGEPVLALLAHEDRPEGDIDLRVRTASRRLAVEVRGTDQIAVLERALAHLRRAVNADDELPLVVVPYMGPSARAWAREHGLSWADLSGNADIRAANLRVVASGQENRFARRGRPSNPFAPKYARISRILLTDPDRWWRQRDLCEAAALSDGTVSRAVGHLQRAGLLEGHPDGALRPRTPDLLLDAWAQRYAFTEHRVHKFQIAARTGPDALQALRSALGATGVTWAATGLSAAYAWTRFADFRLNTLFVDALPRDPESRGLFPVERGENVWLVVPRDPGVFYGRSDRDGWCAHPVQVYLDLRAHPERAADAAARLRADLLRWRS